MKSQFQSLCVLAFAALSAGAEVACTDTYSDDGGTLFVEGEVATHALNLTDNALTIAPAENAETAKLTFIVVRSQS